MNTAPSLQKPKPRVDPLARILRAAARDPDPLIAAWARKLLQGTSAGSPQTK